MILRIILPFLIVCFCIADGPTYPIDGYSTTNIRRLNYLEMVVDSIIKGPMPIPGAMRKSYEIQLNLDDERGDALSTIPAPDPELQEAINNLFPRSLWDAGGK